MKFKFFVMLLLGAVGFHGLANADEAMDNEKIIQRAYEAAAAGATAKEICPDLAKVKQMVQSSDGAIQELGNYCMSMYESGEDQEEPEVEDLTIQEEVSQG